MSRDRTKLKQGLLCGICPDIKCHTKLYFPHFDSVIECTHCGQQHQRSSLKNVQDVSNLDAHLNDMIRNILMSNIIPKRGPETIKVLGLSNYHCKLLSPLLTRYGMDKRTGKAKLLMEMNQGDIFDCGLFGDRAFLIEPEHIPVPGYGRDASGSMNYLSQTLELIKRVNDGEERLLPIHADGDGHCLVHAVSRALVGRELFWHPLRCSLKKHFEDNLKPYQELFKDFVDESDWRYIIDECDPDFVPPEGEILGLRNIHVFGLANVLKRPIILLDSLECMNSLGDYAALFLPSLISPELCRGKNNRLNKPLCIAWSSPGHNHYIPLVGIKKKPLPVLPVDLLPKAWGVPQSQILTYMEFEGGSYCTIGGDRSLADSYVMRLVVAMEELFLEKFGVHPNLVSDVHHYLYQSSGVVSTSRELVVESTKKAVQEGRLYRCLSCDAVCEQVIKPQWFSAGGVLYNMALIQYGKFVPNQLYPFPLHGIVCRYDAQRNELQPDLARSSLENCTWCNGKTLRKVRADGSVVYKNEDKTKTPTNSTTCGCGFKHYWCGKEYDNPPKKLNVVLEWNNRILRDTVVWFEGESDPTLNSNVYDVAREVVQKHFPGEFGSERLVQTIVEQLLGQTLPKKIVSSDSEVEDYPLPAREFPANKIVLSGSGVLHKEELGMSETEKQILYKLQENAESLQRRSEVLRKNEVNIAHAVSQPSLQIIEKDKPVAESDESIKTEPVEQKKVVRVVTSDGRQENLVLGEGGITYSTLQAWVEKEFQINPLHQRLKYGFPLQELTAPEGNKSLPLSHGDRVIVEMVHEKSSPQKRALSPATPTQSRRDDSQQTVNQWMQMIESFKTHNTDSKLLTSATTCLSNQLMWNYGKKMPHLFKRGGIFYQEVAGDSGLVDGKHYNIPSFPDKVFCYNKKNDLLELCVKPYGHFPVNKDIDLRIDRASQFYLRSTSSACRTLQPSACLKRDSYDGMESHSLVRKGPGYSVLSTSSPVSEVQVDKLQTLANQLTGVSHISAEPMVIPRLREETSTAESCDTYSAPVDRTDKLSSDISSTTHDSSHQCNNSEMDCT